MDHTPEPWAKDGVAIKAIGHSGNEIITVIDCSLMGNSSSPALHANLKRIISCVNAMSMIGEPENWIIETGRWLKEAKETLKEITEFDHPEMKIGQSKSEFLLKLASERDEFKQEIFDLEQLLDMSLTHLKASEAKATQNRRLQNENEALTKETARLQRKIERARCILQMVVNDINTIPIERIPDILQKADRILDYDPNGQPAQQCTCPVCGNNGDSGNTRNLCDNCIGMDAGNTEPETQEKITVNAEFLFELESKQAWVNRVPKILPQKIRGGEQWIWLDKNGNVFELGKDFMAAEKHNTYPCRVYRVQNVAGWADKLDNQTKP